VKAFPFSIIENPLGRKMSELHFEEVVVKAMRGEISEDDLTDALVEAQLVVCSRQEIGENGAGFLPLLFDRGDQKFLAVFTNVDRAKLCQAEAPHCVVMVGNAVVARIPRDCGLVLNPGHDVGFEMPPWGIEKIRERIKSKF
jgi:hypothetical protein